MFTLIYLIFESRFGALIIICGGFIAVGLISTAFLDRFLLIRRLETLAREHLDILCLKRQQTVYIDEYGKEDRSDWDREIERFHNRVIENEIRRIPKSFDTLVKTTEIVDRLTKSRVRRPKMLSAVLENGVAFEVRCAKILRSHGWAAYPTKASGDQGADVIAERNGIRVIIQCKRYQGRVGNKAVQEISAAMAHYDADIAAVVTTGSYTKSAYQLAKSTHVLLLHEDELTKLSDHISVLTARQEARGSENA